MQVSWIEPDELRDLASKLMEPQKPEAAPTSWELHTLPEFSPAMPGGMFDPLGDAPTAPAASVAPIQSQMAPALGADIASIREKLRAIRDRALDAGLLPPPAPAAAPSPAPVPFAYTAPPALEPAPAPVQEAAPAPVVETAHAPTPSPTKFLPLEGTIAERLDSFAHWATQLTQAEELILVDDHGDSLWGVPSRNDLVVSAMLALGSSMRSNASEISNPSTVVRSKAGPENDLAIMPCSTHYGMVTLAIVNHHEVSDDVVACLRQGLIEAIDGARVA